MSLLSSTRFEQLDPAVIRASKRGLVDWLGVTLAAVDHNSSEILFRLLQRLHPAGDATYVARGARGSMLDVALLHGHQSHVMDYDETHTDMFLHPSSPIFAALLPLAEVHHLSGRDVIIAHVVGVEISDRLLRRMYPSHYNDGWHTTGTIGTLGAAMAGASALKLDTPATVHALGIAASQMAGIHENRGSMTKAFHVGKAATNGLLAALLAFDGFTSRESCFEGDRGVFSLFSSTEVFDTLEDHRTRWAIHRSRFKPHACGVSLNPIVDAALAVRNRIPYAEVDVIELFVNRTVAELLRDPDPPDGLRARVSPEHCVAVALLDGKAQPEQFTDGRVRSHDVTTLRQRTTIACDSSVSPEQARIRVRLRDGRTESAEIDAALGSAHNPMSDEALLGKYFSLATPVLGSGAHTLAEMVWNFDALDDVAALASQYGTRQSEASAHVSHDQR